MRAQGRVVDLDRFGTGRLGSRPVRTGSRAVVGARFEEGTVVDVVWRSASQKAHGGEVALGQAAFGTVEEGFERNRGAVYV